MKILIVGAAGKTGRALAEQAVIAGHDVTALIHTGPDFDVPGVHVLIGDAREQATVRRAVTDQDAVIDTVGGKTPYRRTTLETDVANAIIDAMRYHHVRRLIATSSVGVGDSIANTPHLVRVIVATFLRGSTRDKTAMEEAIRATDLEWTIVRPAVLVDQPPSGQVVQFSASTREPARSITRIDLATYLLTELTARKNIRERVTIANG